MFNKKLMNPRTYSIDNNVENVSKYDLTNIQYKTTNTQYVQHSRSKYQIIKIPQKHISFCVNQIIRTIYYQCLEDHCLKRTIVNVIWSYFAGCRLPSVEGIPRPSLQCHHHIAPQYDTLYLHAVIESMFILIQLSLIVVEFPL